MQGTRQRVSLRAAGDEDERLMALMGRDTAMWSFPVNASTSLHAAYADPVVISWPFMVDSVQERR